MQRPSTPAQEIRAQTALEGDHDIQREGVCRHHDSRLNVVSHSDAGFVAAACRDSTDREAAVEGGPVEKRLFIEAARSREKSGPSQRRLGGQT